MTKNSFELLSRDIEHVKKIIQSNYETTKEEFAHLHTKIDHMDKKLEGEYVRRDVFEAVISPLRNIVYGLVSVTLTTLVGAVLFYILNIQK